MAEKKQEKSELKPQKDLVIKLDGGLGRNIAMTGLITAIAKQRPVRVVCSRPCAFRGNPYIKSIHGLNDRRLFQDVIRGNDYIELEPYTNPKFFNDGVNWLEIVREQLGLDKIYYPELYLADREKSEYQLQCNNGCNQKIILFQPFGSTMTINGSDKSYRSIPIDQAQYMVNELNKKGYTVFTCESDKQPQLMGVNSLRQVTDLRFLIGLAYRYPVLGADSCMHHASVGFGKKPTVLRAGTDSGRFGYDEKEFNYREFAMKEYTPMRLPMNDFDFDNSNQGTNNFSIEFLDKILANF